MHAVHEIDTATSFVKIKARSTLHDIEGRGVGLTGVFEADFYGDRLVVDGKPNMRLEIPVSRLDSGNAMQDREMHKLISSKSFPNISATLSYAVAKENPNDYSVAGQVTIRGTTRLMTGHLAIRQRDGHVEIDGEKTLDIRSFGIQPPRILNFQVYPEVSVVLHLVARLKT